MKSILVLDNLRSVYNVGSIFRTANAVGVERIILCGTTPTPLDKWGNKRKDFTKVALGAEETISWEYYESTADVLTVLKKDSVYIVAIEQDEKSVDYKNVFVDGQTSVAFVIGPEVTGMSEEVLSKADVIAEIPMLGSKESLNVTIATGVALYRILGI
jgi:tRNA G18 (ribose-2'-O)-methylase SpoU